MAQESTMLPLETILPTFSLPDVVSGNTVSVYQGQLDDSRPDSGIPVTGKDIRAAIDAVLSNQPVDPNQKPSVGCSIKWKA